MGDFYGSEDEVDESLLSDTEDNYSRNNKKNNKKSNKFNPPLKANSPEDDDNLQFGTFDFTNGKPVPMYLSESKKKKKNLPKLLQRAEKLQKQLQEESEQGQKKAESYKWERMMKKAQGEKLKDNPILLAKKMATIKKKKKQSAIKWKARTDQVEKDKDIRFQKKMANIKAKMDRKKMAALRKTIGASKLKTTPKRGGGGGGGKKRAGFEGKKGSNFINK